MKIRMPLSWSVPLGALLAASLTLPLCGQMKPTPNGLVTMGDMSFVNEQPGTPDNSFSEAMTVHPGYFTGVVLKVTWSQLQPNSASDFDTTAIDSALQAISDFNSTGQYPPLKAVLRVFAAANTPLWVLTDPQVGSVSLLDDAGTQHLNYPRAWTAEYGTLWRQLQAQLAAKYDTNPLIEEVAITSCALLDGEPFKTASDQADITIERTEPAPPAPQVGYTDAQELTCLNNAATEDYAAWTHTPLEFAFSNVLLSDGVTKAPGYKQNSQDALEIMATFRSTYGSQAILASHGYNNPIDPVLVPLFQGGTYGGVTYNGIDALGSPASYQSGKANVDPTDQDGGSGQLIYNAMSNDRATEFELFEDKPSGGVAKYSTNQLGCWQTAFAAGVPTNCSY